MVPIKTSFCFGFKLFPSPHINKSLRCFSDLTLDDIKRLIPKRIERGPTDILKALSQTHKRDPTAYDYKFMDDPYFYPLTNNAKRTSSLCMESGRKSARWIVKQYPQLFDHKVSDPFIQALAPKIEYNEDSDVAEETLLGAIEGRNVSDAIIIYSLLKKKGVEVSKDTKQLLLELVCFYNCEKLFDEPEPEISWYQNPTWNKEEFKTWKDKGFAEELFKDINSDCSQAYSTLIQGMFKYGQVEEAMNLYNEGKTKNLKFTIEVYNRLIEKSASGQQDWNQIWLSIISVLNEIQSNKLMPDVYTLNSILEVLRKKRTSYIGQSLALSVISEFESIGIRPSLGTYRRLLEILCQSKRNVHENRLSLKNILDRIPIKKIEVQHPDDLGFFVSVMQICENLNDIESANYVLSVFRENNENLVGGVVNEKALYKSYLSVVFNNEPIEQAMKVYTELVPTITNIEVGKYFTILSSIKENEAFEFLPVIWKDVTLFFRFDKLVDLAGKVAEMSEVWKSESCTSDEIHSVFSEAVNICLKHLGSPETFGKKCDVSDVIIALLKLNNYNEVLPLLERILNENLFVLKFKAVELFFNCCLKTNKKEDVLLCLKVAEKMDYPKIQDMAQNALDLFNEDVNYDWVKNLSTKKTKKKVLQAMDKDG